MFYARHVCVFFQLSHIGMNLLPTLLPTAACLCCPILFHPFLRMSQSQNL